MRCLEFVACLYAVLAPHHIVDGTSTHQSSPANCEYHSDGEKLVCEDIIDPSFLQDIAESTKLM